MIINTYNNYFLIILGIGLGLIITKEIIAYIGPIEKFEIFS